KSHDAQDPSRRHAERPQRRPTDAGAPMAAKSDAWKCTECHGLGAGTEQGLKAHRFADCSGCHKPHGANIVEPSPCTDCHQDVSANHGAPKASVQHTCMTCHQKMHTSKAAAKESCAQCHAQTTPAIPE